MVEPTPNRIAISKPCALKSCRAWVELSRTIEKGESVSLNDENYTSEECILEALRCDPNCSDAWTALGGFNAMRSFLAMILATIVCGRRVVGKSSLATQSTPACHHCVSVEPCCAQWITKFSFFDFLALCSKSHE